MKGLGIEKVKGWKRRGIRGKGGNGRREEDRETGGTARLGYLSRGRRVPIYATAFTAATCYY